jgi:hypothetical protein
MRVIENGPERDFSGLGPAAVGQVGEDETCQVCGDRSAQPSAGLCVWCAYQVGALVTEPCP